MAKPQHITDTDIPARDHLSGCRAYYNQVTACMALPANIAAAAKAVEATFHTGITRVGSRGGYDAWNADLYDIAELPNGDVLALFQQRHTVLLKATRWPETSKTYILVRVSRKGKVQWVNVDITGQAVHAAIRSGRSPISRLLEKPLFRQAVDASALAAPKAKAA